MKARPFFRGMACASQPSLVEQCGKADTRQPVVYGNTGGPKFDFIIHVTSEVGGSFTYIRLIDPCKSTVGRRHGKINYWTVYKASVVIVSCAGSSFPTRKSVDVSCQGLHSKLLRPNLEKLLWLFSTQTSQGFKSGPWQPNLPICPGFYTFGKAGPDCRLAAFAAK